MISWNRIIFILILILSCPLAQPLSARAEEKQMSLHPAPDWVHPGLRKKYPGYKKQKERKTDSPSWQYSTNRPLGNIRAGGSTEYQDYRPFYSPPKKGKTTQKPAR